MVAPQGEGGPPALTFAPLTDGDRTELARLRALQRYVPTCADLSSGKYMISDGASFAAMYEEIYGMCHYAFPPPGRPPNIVDGGGNVGVAARWFAQHYPEATIISFEPDPAIFELLRTNTEATWGVELHMAALGARGSTTTFYAEGSDAGRLAAPTEAPGQTIEVALASLGEVLRRLGHVDMLKLDVEGAELEVLEEASAELSRIQYAYVEFHSIVGRPQRFGELLRMLEKEGFRYRIESVEPTPAPLLGRPADRGVEFTCGVFASRPERAPGEPTESESRPRARAWPWSGIASRRPRSASKA